MEIIDRDGYLREITFMSLQTFHVAEDTPATIIPAGNPITLPAGMEVSVTQALGGSVTIRAEAGLCRVAPGDVAKLNPELAKDLAAKQDQTATSEVAEGDEALWEALRGCFDPEIPLNIVDLGLIYDLEAKPSSTGEGRDVAVKMTLTAQGCGMGPTIAADARERLLALPDVASAEVEIVWDPAWTPHMISEEGRQILGLA